MACARELAAWEPMSRWSSPVEDVKGRESNVDVGSLVRESLLGYDFDSEKKSS